MLVLNTETKTYINSNDVVFLNEDNIIGKWIWEHVVYMGNKSDFITLDMLTEFFWMELDNEYNHLDERFALINPSEFFRYAKMIFNWKGLTVKGKHNYKYDGFDRVALNVVRGVKHC